MGVGQFGRKTKFGKGAKRVKEEKGKESKGDPGHGEWQAMTFCATVRQMVKKPGKVNK